MKVRKLHFGSDYPEVCEWWRARNFPAPGKARLPPDGLIAEADGVKIAAAWVYISGGMGFFEWLVVNPKAPLRKRKPAIAALIEFVKVEAPTVGVSAVFTSLANENLIKLYELNGFQKTETAMTNLVMKVGL